MTERAIELVVGRVRFRVLLDLLAGRGDGLVPLREFGRRRLAEHSEVDVESEDRRAVRAGDDFGYELVEQRDGVVAEAQGFDHGLGLPVQQFGKRLADGLAVDATQGDLLTHVVDRFADGTRCDRGLSCDQSAETVQFQRARRAVVGDDV